MNASPEPVERYLSRLKTALQGATTEEQEEILSDIRSLIQEHLDTAGSDSAAAETVLQRLGPPEALADSYRVEGLLSRAAHSSEPVLLMTAALRWAMGGFLGFATAFTAFIGYGVTLLMFFSAIAKLISPAETGMWVGQGHFHIGQLREPHPGVRDVLGPWMAPLGILLGLSFYVLTNYAVRWLIRQRDQRLPLKPH